MKSNSLGAFDPLDPSTDAYMYNMHNLVINEEQHVICSRAYQKRSEIDWNLMWLSKPNQTQHENFTSTMEDVLRQMIKYESDIKRCFTFYGNALYDLNSWLKGVNVTHEMALGDTYNFEFVAQVRIQLQFTGCDFTTEEKK